jgi:hypothetical protein
MEVDSGFRGHYSFRKSQNILISYSIHAAVWETLSAQQKGQVRHLFTYSALMKQATLSISKVRWPSGLRRQTKDLVRKGVGSNPTLITLFVIFWHRHAARKGSSQLKSV